MTDNFIELRHLKMICEVARSKTLTKAAPVLFISQSALSHQLKEAEEYFKAKLFVRRNREMVLTQIGQKVLEGSSRILSELENTKLAVRKFLDNEYGEVRISTQCYSAYPWLSKFLPHFHGRYPNIDLKIVSEATGNILSTLLAGHLDIGIVEEKKSKKLDYHSLFTDEILIVVSKRHRFASRKWILPEMLQEDPYIMYTIPTEESSFYNIIFKKREPARLFKIALTEGILEMVKADLGFCILPHWTIEQHLNSGELRALRITKKGMKRNWYAAVVKNKPQPPCQETFIKLLSKHMKGQDEMNG